jgi:hypothetical protein
MTDVLVLFSNSPGELSAWVYPMCVVFHQQHPDVDIVVVLSPCQYASGQEPEVAAAFPGVREVISASQMWSLVFGTRKLAKPYQNGVVCFLGGDPLYSKRFAKRNGWPVLGYTEHHSLSSKGFLKLFYRKPGYDLMASKIALLPPFDKEALLNQYHFSDQSYTLFMLGSRPQHFNAMASFFFELLPKMVEKYPNFHPIVLVSPFISDALLSSFTAKSTLPFPVCRGDSMAFIRLASVMISLPGTNMAEAMYLHTPMGMILPLNNLKVLIFDGLFGWMSKVPILGHLLLKLVVAYLKTKKRMYALPNRLSGRYIVPESIQEFTYESMEAFILSCQDPAFQAAQKKDLQDTFIPSLNVANEISESLFLALTRQQ